MTENEVLQLLRRHYLFDRGRERGNGDEWGFLPHVRDKAGMSASRTCDLLCFGLWPSRGLTIIGHEIKCSRSDWLTELRKPAKAEAFHEACDGWYLVVADETIVHPGELPDGWGLMVVGKGRNGVEKIVVATPAPLKPKEERMTEISRSFVAALLKVACRTMDATPEEIQAARDEARQAEQDLQARLMEQKDERIEELRSFIRTFESEAGVVLSTWHGEKHAADVGRALRLVLQGESSVARIRRDLENVVRQATRVGENAQKTLDAIIAGSFDEDDLSF